MKIRYQVGAESFVEGKRVVRLTALDGKTDVEDTFGALILMVHGSVDASDIQPGDGEIDMKLGTIADNLLSKFPLLKKAELLPGEENLFLRLRAV